MTYKHLEAKKFPSIFGNFCKSKALISDNFSVTKNLAFS